MMWVEPDCEYSKAWQTVVFIQIGGGLDLDICIPSKPRTAILHAVIGGWNVGVSSMLVSCVNAVFDATVQLKYDGPNGGMVCHYICKWSMFVLVLWPLIGVTLMFVFSA